MPIRFRCSYCNRLLGIASRKAGMETTCPHCGYSITVPTPEEVNGQTERMDLDDVEALLGKTATNTSQTPVRQVPVNQAAIPVPPPVKEVIEPEFEVAPPAKQNPPAPPPPKVLDKPTKPAPAVKAPKPISKSTNSEDRPLFEGDVDELLGMTDEPKEIEREKPSPISGMDAMSLGETTQKQITLSSLSATLLMAAVVVLLGLAFAAGYFLAPKG